MGGLSLIIPVYNEEKHIENTVSTVENYFNKKKFDYEILLVDDGSKDNSVDVIKKLLKKDKIKLFSNGVNKGKGFSVRHGIGEAKKDIICFMDADMPYPIEDIENFLSALKNCDVVIGSRALPNSIVEAHPTWYRRILGRVFHIVTLFLVGVKNKDTQCGFKGFKNEAAKKIFSKQKINGFGFDAEVLYLANKYGFPVKEVPIRLYKMHSFKESRLNPVFDSIKMFLDLCKIKLNNFVGKY